MYRVSPFTYFVEGIIGTAVANTPVTCGSDEYQVFNPPNGQNCGQYMQSYISQAGGYLLDDGATTNCQFCQLDNTNVFLDNFMIKYSNRWRDFGLLWVFIIFNVFAAIALYWLVRVVSPPCPAMGIDANVTAQEFWQRRSDEERQQREECACLREGEATTIRIKLDCG